MIKKILSFMLASLLIFSVNIYAQDEQIASSDYNYEYAKGIISVLYPDVISEDDGSYSRTEFLTAIVHLMKGNHPIVKKQSGFLDVAAESDLNGFLSFGVDLGLISKADYFNPEAKITYTDALTIAVRALGYNDYAKTHGGYPTGYLRCANELELTDGLAGDTAGALSYRDGLVLMYNMIGTDVLEAKIFSGENVEYIKTEGINFIYTYQKICIAEGVVDANEYTGKYSKDENASEGSIRVGNLELKGNYSELLGYNAKVYYRDDSSKAIVYAHKYENAEMHLGEDDGVRLYSGYFNYIAPNGNTKKVSLEQSYSLIYNGKAISLGRLNAISPDNRTWTFVDNNDNGRYDTIFVTDTKYMVASRVDTAEEVIYDYNKKQSVLDLGVAECVYAVYTPDGKMGGLYSIVQGTPIGYTLSDDGELCVIRIFDNSVAGFITGMVQNKKIYIDDVAYELSKYYIDNINTFSMGTRAICYLGYDNKVIFIDEIVDNEMKYAFIVDIGMESGISKAVYLKIFTQDSEMLIAELAGKVIFNGSSQKADAVYTAIDSLINSGASLTGDALKLHDGKRIIKYTMDSEGRVNRIALADELSKVSQLQEYRGAYDSPFIYSSGSCYHRYGIFSPYAVTSSSTIFFKVPLSATDRNSDDNYEIVTSDFFGNGECFITAYDVTRGGFAPVVLVSSDEATIDEDTASAVVERVYETIDSDGNKCYALQLYMSGEYSTYYANEAYTKSDSYQIIKNTLGAGDIIRATVNNKMEIKSIQFDFDYSAKDVLATEEPLSAYDGSKFTSKENAYLWGRVYSREGENLLIVPYNYDMSADILTTTNAALPSDNIASTTAAISKTVFVKIIRSRDGATIQSAEVYKEKSADAIKSYMQAGSDADFIVSRTRYRQPSLTVVYTN